MGQRHQIFVRVINPAQLDVRDAVKEQLEKEFGRGETTVLAFHNQWLFGRSALINAMNLLRFSMQEDKKTKLDKDAWSNYDNPLCKKFFSGNKVEKWLESIAFIMNFRQTTTPYQSAGIGNSWYIGKSDEGIRDDFRLGDNNDGITIIDTIENKYCFMNISDYDRDDNEIGNSSSDLPYLVPVTARQYVSAYYPETVETASEYKLKDNKTDKPLDEKKLTKMFAENVRHNVKVAKPFDKFELLTLEDLQAMFPKMVGLLNVDMV